MISEHLHGSLHQARVLLLVHLRMALDGAADHLHESHRLFLWLFVFGGVIAGSLRIRFRHVFAVFSLSVPALTFVVINLGIGVHPNSAVASARRGSSGVT